MCLCHLKCKLCFLKRVEVFAQSNITTSPSEHWCIIYIAHTDHPLGNSSSTLIPNYSSTPSTWAPATIQTSNRFSLGGWEGVMAFWVPLQPSHDTSIALRYHRFKFCLADWASWGLQLGQCPIPLCHHPAPSSAWNEGQDLISPPWLNTLSSHYRSSVGCIQILCLTFSLSPALCTLIYKEIKKANSSTILRVRLVFSNTNRYFHVSRLCNTSAYIVVKGCCRNEKTARILGLRRIQSRARWAWSLRALCNKVLSKYKGDKASDIGIRRGQKECPPASLQLDVV